MKGKSRFAFFAASLMVLTTVPILPHEASAQTSNTCYFNYALAAPKGTYKVELFEAGSPYPSRQTFLTSNGTYNIWSSWSYICVGRTYFVRVSNSKNAASQTHAFYVNTWYAPGNYNFGIFYWGNAYGGH